MNAMPNFNLSQRGPWQLCRHAAGPSHEVKSMRRFLTPPVVLLAGLALALAGCSGETPTSPKPQSGPGSCAVTITLDATSVNPMAGSAVIVRATVKKAGVAVPDGTPVVFTTDSGYFLESGLPSVSKVTQNGFADVTLASGSTGTAKVHATSDCALADIAIQYQPVPADGPYISSMTPLTGSCKGGDTVTINGGRFMTSLNVQPRVTFGGAPATVTSASATLITVLTPARTLADSSVPETVDVVVTVNPGTAAIQSTAPKKFTYTCIDRRVAVTSVVPNMGRQEGNEPVVVGGLNFGTNAATTRVTFGGVPASITGQTDTVINVLTPRHTLANPAVPETVDVVVTIDLGLPTQQSGTLPHAFTYFATGPGTPCNSDPRLFISGIVLPAAGSTTGSPDGGDVVTINGGGFWFGSASQPTPMSRIQVTFGGIQGQVTSWTDSSITVVTPRITLTSPDAPQTVDIQVTVDVGGARQTCVTAPRSYTYFPTTYLDPWINSISPSSGPNDVSTRVTIFGKNFRMPLQVFVGTAEATVASVTPSQIVFQTPIASGANIGMAGTTQPVQVRDTYSGKTATSPVSFHYYPCPTAGTAAPATAPWNVSTPVTISGNNFQEPVEAVFIYSGNTFRVSVFSVSANFIIVQMPSLDQVLGTGNFGCADVVGSIQLTFPSLACAGTIAVPFTYQMNRPTIATVQPQTAIPQLSGTVGATVTGSNFVDPMSVTVGGVTVNATVSNSGVLTFVAPRLPNSAFLTEPCQPTGSLQLDGQRYVDTWMDVTVTNLRTGCSATLPKALLFSPNDTTCRAPLTLTGAPSVVSGNMCVAVAGTIASFTVYGGTTPYVVTPPLLPSFLTYVPPPALPAAQTFRIDGNGGAPNLNSFTPVNLAGQPVRAIPYTVTVTDAVGATATKTFNFSVFDPGAPLAASIAASQAVNPAPGLGSSMTAAGGAGVLNWALSGVTPAPATGGFSLTAATGASSQISVAAATPNGTYTMTVTVTDSLACAPQHTVGQAVSFKVGP